MFLWSAVCMISEWKNFSKNKWITLAPTPSDVSGADTAARLWSLAHHNRGDRRWGKGPAVAPSTLTPHFGTDWGSGAAPLGVHMPTIARRQRTKVWPFANGAGNRVIPWDDWEFSTSKAVLRFIFLADLFHTVVIVFILMAKFGLRGPNWTMHAVMQQGEHVARTLPSNQKKSYGGGGLWPDPLVCKTIFSLHCPAPDWGLQVVSQRKK